MAVWTPTTQQVAVYAPWLTVSTSVPGAQGFVNDFTSDTSPDAAVAGVHIADAGVLVSTAIPIVPSALVDLARTVTARYAAATLAAAYARTDEDAQRAAAMLASAKDAFKTLVEAADNAGAAPLSPLPVAYAPEPVPWGDDLVIGGNGRYPRQYLFPE